MGFRWLRCNAALLAVLALSGCEKKPSGTTQASARASGPASRSGEAPRPAASLSAAAASASSAPPPPPASAAHAELAPDEFELANTAEAQELFERESRLARKAAAEKRYDAAIDHYGRALSTGRNDARCLGERGYLRLLTKQLNEAEEDLWYAAGANGTDRVLAQVWYNLGVLFADRKQPEFARAAFARSLARNPSPAAKAKLGGQWSCESSIRKRGSLEEHSWVAIVDGWRGVQEFSSVEGEPKSDEEARALVCGTDTEGVLGAPRAAPDCSDSPPWTVYCCGGFSAHQLTIYPRAGARFLVAQAVTRLGSPRECRSGSFPEHSVHGNVLVIKSAEYRVGANGDFDESRLTPSDDVPNPDPPCRSGPEEITWNVYDLDSARRLLEVKSVAPHVPTFSVDPDGKQLTLSGYGCDIELPLR